MSNHILSADDHETLIRAALDRIGLGPAEVQAIMAARWPMEADGAIETCHTRGWDLSTDDATAFLHNRFGFDVCPDGVPLAAELVTWPEYLVNQLLSWATDNNVGSPVAPDSDEIPRPTRELMLEALRSADIATRTISGAFLAKSLGKGVAMAGETPEDVEYIIGPQLVALITRAMGGDGSAVDELEALTTSNPQQADTKQRRRDPARSKGSHR